MPSILIWTAHNCAHARPQESILLALRFPTAKKKVDEELGKARIDIERKMVPQGVSRYLALPAKGQDPAWILAEMEKMDEQVGKHANWRDGKVSGAVYRESPLSSPEVYHVWSKPPFLGNIEVLSENAKGGSVSDATVSRCEKAANHQFRTSGSVPSCSPLSETDGFRVLRPVDVLPIVSNFSF